MPYILDHSSNPEFVVRFHVNDGYPSGQPIPYAVAFPFGEAHSPYDAVAKAAAYLVLKGHVLRSNDLEFLATRKV